MCVTCILIREYVVNLALALDRVLNALLAGSSNETVSQRLARAERAGRGFAAVACRILGWFHRDHCSWSLDGRSTMGRELWSWSRRSEP